MLQRSEKMFFALAAATVVLGLATDALRGELAASGWSFTGMYSSTAAVLCGGLLCAARGLRSRERTARAVVYTVGSLVALNFVRLVFKWSDGLSLPDERALTGALLVFGWTMSLWTVHRSAHAHDENRAAATSSTRSPHGSLLRFGSVACALLIFSVLFTVRVMHTPTASMATDLLDGEISSTTNDEDDDDREDASRPGEPDRGPDRTRRQPRSGAPRMSIGPVT